MSEKEKKQITDDAETPKVGRLPATTCSPIRDTGNSSDTASLRHALPELHPKYLLLAIGVHRLTKEGNPIWGPEGCVLPIKSESEFHVIRDIFRGNIRQLRQGCPTAYQSLLADRLSSWVENLDQWYSSKFSKENVRDHRHRTAGVGVRKQPECQRVGVRWIALFGIYFCFA